MTDHFENDKPEEETEPKRRWYQYSLRSLVLVMTVVCLWLGYISNEARKQRNAVAWVEEMGGHVEYDYEPLNPIDVKIQDGKVYFYEIVPEPPGPDWLREWIGIDYFSDVARVYLMDTIIKDLSQLESLTNLKLLTLSYPEVSEEEVQKLQEALPNCQIDVFEVVDFDSNPFSDTNNNSPNPPAHPAR